VERQIGCGDFDVSLSVQALAFHRGGLADFDGGFRCT
jgi:hypothetical protein